MKRSFRAASFNTQPPEGGWALFLTTLATKNVSTHSRLKAAGIHKGLMNQYYPVSTHSRLKAAGRKLEWTTGGAKVSTHSRLKAAGKSSL